MNRAAHFWAWTLLFICFVWGVGFALVHDVLKSVEAISFNAVRFFVAVLTLGLYLQLTRARWWRRINRATLHHGVILGAFLFVAFTAQNIGLTLTTASNAGFITGLSVLFVPLLSLLWLKQRQSPVVWVGVALATAGTFLLTGGIHGFGKGELWVLLCALGFALHIVYTGVYVRDVDALSLSLVQLVAMCLFSFAGAWWFEPGGLTQAYELLLVDVQWSVWLVTLIEGVLGGALAYVAQTVGQQYLESWRVALIYATEPLFAAMGAYLLLGEVLAPVAWMGALLILAGMLIAELVDN